jgi:acyl-CoA thioesterase I
MTTRKFSTRHLFLQTSFLFVLTLICSFFSPHLHHHAQAQSQLRSTVYASKPIRVEDYKKTIRVSCVGDSITFGAGISNRKQNSYPVQLGKLLGDKFDVKNFGVNGATLLKKGDKPYWKQGAYKAALAFKPHVVIIKLGTNDTKPNNWKHKSDYATDYLAMITEFRKLPSKPRIWLCLPVPAYPERWGIRDTVIKGEVVPLVLQVAKTSKTTAIDLYTALSNKPKMFPDKIHPNAEGAAVMAKVIANIVAGIEHPKPKASK